MKSWERDLESHLRVLNRFAELVRPTNDDAPIVAKELARYVRLRLARGQWMYPEITRFHTEWYREFYRTFDVEDPYHKLKDHASAMAGELLETLTLPTLRDAVLASIVANRLDYGAPELCTHLATSDFAFPPTDLFVDDFEDLARQLRQASSVLYLVDNSGEALFDAVVLERIHELNPACRLVLAAKSSPMLNDVTAVEASRLSLPPGVTVIATGSNCFGVPRDEVSDEFLHHLCTADIVVAKGQAYLEFWIGYDVERVFNVAWTKIPVVDAVMGHIPPGVGLILSSARYRSGKPTYDASRHRSPELAR